MKSAGIGLCVAAFATLLCSCAAGPPAEQPSAAQPTGCPVLEANDFVAWIDTMPGPKGATLHVAGKLTLPSSGYTAQLKPGILDRRQPPLQRLRLEITPPDGPAAQVITIIELNGQFPAAADRYRGVTILCGTETLVEISDVEVVS